MTKPDLQEGNIVNHRGTKIKGLINRSSLTSYYSYGVCKEYSIKYLVKGKEEYTVDGKKHTLEPGQFLLVKPNQEVETRIRTSHKTHGVCVYLDQRHLDHELGCRSEKTNLIFPNFPLEPKRTEVHGLLNGLKGNIQTEADQLLVQMAQALSRFLSTQNHKLASLEAKRPNTRQFLWERVESARNYLHRHISENISLPELADFACLSPFHFQRAFKAVYDLSPKQYLLNLRIERALKLIDLKKDPIEDIADQCGFNDVKYFKKCLKIAERRQLVDQAA